MKSPKTPFITKLWATTLTEYAVVEPTGVVAYDEREIKVAKLNLLIGPNNSGKSRFARKLYDSMYSKILLRNEVFYDFFSQEGLRPLLELLEQQHNVDPVIAFPMAHVKKLRSGSILPTACFTDIYSGISTCFEKIVFGNLYDRKPVAYEPLKQLRQTFKLDDTAWKDQLYVLERSCVEPKRYYIPVLRGLRPLDEKNDLYKDRTRTDYFSQGKSDSESRDTIVTGFNLYGLLTDHLLGKPHQRQRIRELENILGEEFFEGQEITLVPERNSDTVAMQIGNDQQLPIFDLGDGLQQVLIMASETFLETEPSIFIIEEPETALHPGLLRQMAFFLLNHTNHQYFITTQNTFLVDLAECDERVSLCRFTKQFQDPYFFQIRQSSIDRELLLDLGIHPSSVYLANCTIWVEGTTDARYIRCYLDKYKADKPELKKYLENLHYAFVEYQGSNLTHWSFAEDDASTADELADGPLRAVKVCATAFLIADGDIRGKANRVQNLEYELGDRQYVLKCKEIENLLPVEAVRSAAQALYDARKKMNRSFGASEDVTRALHSLTQASYSSSTKGLGYILDAHLKKQCGIKGKLESAKSFAADSGTIKDKVRFCRMAIAAIQQIDEWTLTSEQEELCEKIFAHIKRFNPAKI